MLGVSVPIMLDVTFNGGWPAQPFDPGGRVGFSANGGLNRSDFGMTTGLPAPGSDIGVGDTVTFRIEAEFTGPVPD